MKKYLSLALSVVLLILGLTVPQYSSDISFDSGREKKVDTLEEVVEALDSVGALANGSSFAEYESISFSVRGEQILDFQYTKEINGEQQYIAIEGNISYEVECLLNDDGEAYASYDVIVSAEGSSKSDIETAFVKVKLDIYESYDEVYLRIRQYYSASGALLPTEKAVYLNRWLDISDGDFTGVTKEIPINIFGITDTVSKYLELYEDDFEKDGDSLVIDREGALFQIFSSMSESGLGMPVYVLGTEYEDSKIEIDMSNKYAPEIIIECEASYENAEEDEFIFGPENSASIHIKLFNVGDTDFDFDIKKRDIYDEDDIEDIFEITGRGR